MPKLAVDNGPVEPRKNYPEPVSRLASIRHSLRLVEPYGHGPASDPASDSDIADAWDEADDATRNNFDRRSSELVSAAAAGLEALSVGYALGRPPNEEAGRELADRIRQELAEISRLVLR